MRPAMLRPRARLALLLLTPVLACGGETPREAGARRAAADYPLPPSRPRCERTGHWDACTLRERLDAAGLVPRDSGDSVRRPFMRVAGARLLLGRAELVAFLYEDSTAMRADVRALDSLAAAPRGAGAVWDRPPTLITSDNLAAVLLGGDAQKVERVTLAITAGPPQPDSGATRSP
jgi:hypothetical protein